jgi:predicted choloylglycine hydrolase
MNELTLRGSHRDMGRELGAQMREAGTKLPDLTADQARRTEALVRSTDRFIPALLEEIAGIAEGGGYDERAVQFYSLAIGIVPSCTVVAVSGAHTATGRTLFGRNYDAGPQWSDFTLYRTYPESGYAHIGCCYDLLVGREDGLNDVGLAIAVTGVQGKYTDKPGLWDHIPVRAVLEQCESVDEAVELIGALPHLWTKNFLVADRHGGLAAIEAAQQGVAVDRSDSGFGVIANHFASAALAPFCDEAKIPANSRERVETARGWFETHEEQESRIARDELAELLSTTGQGVRSELGPEFTTVWSWVAELGGRQLLLCDRLPEPEAYRAFEF